MNEWVKSWNDFLLQEKVGYNQVVYAITYKLKISKVTGGNKTQTLNDIRKIPNVTTVFREEKGFEDKDVVMAPYSIKFALERGQSPDMFVRRILAPQLRQIPGLGIQGSMGIEKIS